MGASTLILIFLGTLISNCLGVLYQRAVIKEQNIRATTISVIMAGIGLLVWKTFLAETDVVSSSAAIISYLIGDACGVYAGLRYKTKS